MSNAHGGRIGPNAVIQLLRALEEHEGQVTTRGIFERAVCRHYLEGEPLGMVDEVEVARLQRELFAALPEDRARMIARDAGQRTADYVIAHRLPPAVKALFRILPPQAGAHMLLRAISRHAWTFAGSGRLRIGRRAIEIDANPIAISGCPWHQAVFERMFQRLVCSNARIRKTTCCAEGAAVCRFELALSHG